MWISTEFGVVPVRNHVIPSERLGLGFAQLVDVQLSNVNPPPMPMSFTLPKTSLFCGPTILTGTARVPVPPAATGPTSPGKAGAAAPFPPWNDLKSPALPGG